MTDPVEALDAAIAAFYGRRLPRTSAEGILAALRASGFDVVPTGEGHVEQALWDKFTPGEKLAYGVGYRRRDPVPTGDAGLDHAPDCDVFRIAESWKPYGEPRHCDCGFALWDAKRRGVYNWTPPTGDAGLDTEPSESDPIETFSHPFRAPVVIDGHEYRHTSDCEWLSSSDTGSEYGRLLAERDRLIAEGVDPSDLLVPDAPSSDTGGRG